MHYYQFNIGDYSSHTQRLSIYEDIAYRRLLDLYYLSEQPLNGCSTDVAREIGMLDSLGDVEYVLNKFFTEKNGAWHNKRCDNEIKAYRNKKKAAKKAGIASGKARKAKRTTVEQPLNEKGTGVEPTINHKPITNNHKLKDQNLLPENLKVSMSSDFKLNETNLAWINNSNLNEVEKQHIIDDFIDYWKLDESKKTEKGWQMAFRKNPIVKRAITNSKHRGKNNGSYQQTPKPSLAERATAAREKYEQQIDAELVGEVKPHIRS